MKTFYTIILLICSNTFMTIAWYGHLRMKEISPWFSKLPLILIILLAWGVALFEYMFQVPANRIGFQEDGGPFSLVQLKVIQEIITLIVFTIFASIVFKIKVLTTNHLIAFILLILAVYFVFKE
ncbi:MAG: DMT family protein [Hyphomicrobiales bacterium]